MITRRRFLSACGALTAGAALGPTILIPKARATSPGFGSAKHVLLFYAQGGLRSHALFNAVGTQQHNPYGTQDAAPGTQWQLGAVCGRDDIPTETFGTIPGFHQITSDVSVVAAVDHAPGGQPVVDHLPAIGALVSGYQSSRQGLLARLVQGHPRYSGGVSVSAMPPVDIGGTPFAASETEHRPLLLPGATSKRPPREISRSWATDARERLNGEFAAKVPKSYEQRVTQLHAAKDAAFEFSSILVDPLLDILGAPEASAGGLSNAELVEVLGNEVLESGPSRETHTSWGTDVALALRSFHFGAPMAVVRRNMYDTHQFEEQVLPERSADLTRQLAGLNFLLKEAEHPEGGSYWDHTLVAVVSEFSRNNTEPGSGFNSALGSDHVSIDPDASRNQAIALMGGPLANAGGRLVGATDTEMRSLEETYSMRSLHSTLLDVLGVDASQFWSDAPIAELFS